MGAVLSILFKVATIAGTAGFAIDLWNRFFGSDTPERKIVNSHLSEAVAAGASPDEILKISAGTKYEQIELAGKSPDDFWAGLSPDQQAAIKFSPQTLRNSMDRTSFLGLSSAFLFVAAFGAGLFGAARGLPIIYRTLAAVVSARAKGAGALELMTLLEAGKIEGIAKVWIPGLVAGIAGAGGWLTSSMTNNLNDVDLWGRINLQQAEDDFKKAQAKLAGLDSGSAFLKAAQLPKTRITMTKQAKPTLFLGTLFSARIGNAAVFDRVLDDAITSKEDMQADALANLNKWLASLPGRLIYTINIKNAPYDENGVKQSGMWVSMSMALRRISGQTVPIDEILLGPVDPVVYYPKTQDVTAVQFEMPKLLTGSEIAQLEFPGGDFSVVDKTGNVVPITFKETAALAAEPKVFAGPVPPGTTPEQEAAFRKTGIIPPRTAFETAKLAGIEAGREFMFEGKTFRMAIDTAIEIVPGQIAPPAPGAGAGVGLTQGQPASMPAPAPTPAPAGKTQAPLFEKHGLYVNDIIFSNTPGNILNLRSFGSTAAADLDDIPHNSPMKVLGAAIGPGASVWLFVSVPSLGQFGRNGWVSFDFVKKSL